MRPGIFHPAIQNLVRVAGIVFLFVAPAAAADLPKCLFVSSYHQGYAWSDGVERGLRQTLQGKCQIHQYDMDTKRKKSEEEHKAAALEAKALIESWRPDVVITADDNAAKYLIQPYYRDDKLPFVFCGINWTVKEYGFPYKNVTGMIEVAPVKAMLEEARGLVPGAHKMLYIGADTSTEMKNAARIRKAAEDQGLVYEEKLARTLDAWVAAYQAGQDYDFIVMGSNAGIDDWDTQRAVTAIMPLTRRLTVTSHEWMMPVTMLGMTKVPEEQGEWAGSVALQILDGVAPQSIPVIANRKWDLYLNPGLIDSAALTLPPQLLSKGKVYQ
ncbi:MAG: hypothetical protein KDI22_05285 [Gammaproteobacteria bacterium]|nr:hypothetical protein [Gammaproteobacteria bacterium]MCP5318477.1 hypothetical protein [Chromatiaceae bacterium]MCW5585689.1 hypothetical protein [Chromatiales bacterium]MCB1817645.1 hypothetical protein [Gammaproteobacteria bacterium]HOP15305.1 ABC transporter substrate binding protein [Gammaproteobacteria bacterium]